METLRAFLGMKRGHRRKWADKFVVHFKPSDIPSIGTKLEPNEDLSGYQKIEIQLSDHPAPIVSFNLPHAGIFVPGTRADDHNILPLSMNIAMAEDFKERIRRIGKGKVLLGSGKKFKSVDFGRFLAKIAHSYAMATLGVGSFIPCLTNAIRGRWPMYLSYFVGGALPHTPVQATNYLHTLQVGGVSFPGIGLTAVIVRVRLFACDGFPAYDVVVGQATKATPPL